MFVVQWTESIMYFGDEPLGEILIVIHLGPVYPLHGVPFGDLVAAET